MTAVVAAWGLVDSQGLGGLVSSITGRLFDALDWFFMAAVTAMLILALYLAFSRFGRIVLGKEGDAPEFSTISWLAMLFAAGMGAGLLFWGVAEPISHYSMPPIGEPGSAEAARRAMVLTNFHWGLHAWAVYAVGALVLAYFGFRKGAPHLAGSPIRMAFSGRWVGPVAAGSDVLAVVAVAFGVAGSLAMGVLQFHTGLNKVAGVPLESSWVAAAIMVFVFAAYMTSAATSLDKGIKLLSNFNMALAVLLLLFMLFAGHTTFILRGLVTSTGDYVNNLVSLSMTLYPYQEPSLSGWVHGWTLTYFIWWIAWAPFVGVFIARISRGRTIREFVMGVLFAPTGFSVIWFAVFGGAGFYEDMKGGGGISTLVREDVTGALFALFDRMPMSLALSIVAIVLIFVFLVTSADSATFVLAMLTTGGDPNPPASRKLAWGAGIGLLGGALMLTNNIDVVRALTISGAIPFTFVLLMQCVALIRALRQDEADAAVSAQPGGDQPVQTEAAAAGEGGE